MGREGEGKEEEKEMRRKVTVFHIAILFDSLEADARK